MLPRPPCSSLVAATVAEAFYLTVAEALEQLISRAPGPSGHSVAGDAREASEKRRVRLACLGGFSPRRDS